MKAIFTVKCCSHLHKKVIAALLTAILVCTGSFFVDANRAYCETLENSNLETYNQMIKENPYDYYALYMRGSKYEESEKWDAAVKDFLSALAFIDEGREPPSWIGYNFDKDILLGLILMGLGETYTSLGDYISSSEYYNRLEASTDIFHKLEVDQQMYVRVNLAYDNWLLGNDEEALKQYHTNLLDEDVVNNPSDDKLVCFNESANYSRQVLYSLLQPEMDAYFLIHMDLQAIQDIIETGQLKPFFYPVNEMENYLQGALYLTTGMYGQAAEIFSKMLESGFDAVSEEERNTLHASCLMGLGKAKVMQQKEPSPEIMAYFDQAQALIADARLDMYIDCLYWRGNLFKAMGDMDSYYDCMESITSDPNIALLTDDVSMSYLTGARKNLEKKANRGN